MLGKRCDETKMSILTAIFGARRSLVTMAFLVAALLTSGCYLLPQSWLQDDDGAGEVEPHLRTVSSDKCDEVSSLGAGHNNESSREDLLDLVCNNSFSDNSMVHRAQDWYGEFDERNYSHFYAASIAVFCVGNSRCIGSSTGLSLGYIAYHVDRFDEEKLRAEVEEIDIDAKHQQAFLEKAQASVLEVEGAIDEMDDRQRALMIDVPQEVRQDRVDHFATYDDLYAEYDKLKRKVADEVDDELIASISELRNEYMGRCLEEADVESCITDQLGRPLTELLVRAAIANEEPLRATAEADLLELPDHSTFAWQNFHHQSKAFIEERDQHEAYEEARRDGVDEETLASTFGSPPPFDVDHRWIRSISPDESPSYSAVIDQLDGDVEKVYGYVEQAVDNGDGTIRITFADSVSKTHRYDCVDTDRVERIHRDGTVDYQQDCEYRETETTVHSTPPVTVQAQYGTSPSSEHWIKVVVDPDSRTGYMARAWEDGQRQQLTMVRNYGSPSP